MEEIRKRYYYHGGSARTETQLGLRYFFIQGNYYWWTWAKFLQPSLWMIVQSTKINRYCANGFHYCS